jgi:putative transposase
LGDGFFHVTSRAIDGMALFRDDVDRAMFIDLLARTTLGSMWGCHAYCLMTTHYHLVLETTQNRLSKGMHRLNGIFAQEFNRRHSRKGHVFEERFSAYVIDTDKHFEAACLYVLNNPVRAGLCQRHDQWPWNGGLVRLEQLLMSQALTSLRVGTVPR